MKLGDLVKVRYATKNPYHDNVDGWGTAYMGIIISTPKCSQHSIWQMWCIDTHSSHVLMPGLDMIEIINEGG